MTWFRVDDEICFHPKTLAAGDAAFGAWVRMASLKTTARAEGFVTSAVANQVASKKQLAKLVEVGFLEVREGGYQVHDYLEWNKTTAELSQSKTSLTKGRQLAGRLGGLQKAANRSTSLSTEKTSESSSKTSSKPLANGLAKQASNLAPYPYPYPDQEEEIPERALAGSSGSSIVAGRVAPLRAVRDLGTRRSEERDYIATYETAVGSVTGGTYGVPRDQIANLDDALDKHAPSRDLTRRHAWLRAAAVDFARSVLDDLDAATRFRHGFGPKGFFAWLNAQPARALVAEAESGIHQVAPKSDRGPAASPEALDAHLAELSKAIGGKS